MKITIITVCMNSVNTIEKTIRRVIEQEYSDLEYIVIDGGSTDGTLEVLRQYESYIDKWISEPDNGIYDAMNKGIELSTGEVIAFLNSDDWYEKDAIKIVENAFMEGEFDCTMGKAHDNQAEVIRNTGLINRDIAESIQTENDQFVAINAMVESNVKDITEMTEQINLINGMVDEINTLLKAEE